jgi:hypothetical protein
MGFIGSNFHQEKLMQHQKLEASLSTLILSIGSSAAIALGMAPEPTSGKTMKDVDLARFNIDLLIMLQEKTKNNLSSEEVQFFNRILSDLQLKFVEESKVNSKLDANRK